MKPGTIFFLIIIALLVFLLMRSDSVKLFLKNDLLSFSYKKCTYSIPVKIKDIQSDTIDALYIQRKRFELPNGDEIFYESVDLPAKYAFDKPYQDVLEEIFNFKVQEVYETDGFILFKGEFDIALFYRSRHNMVLLYPANDLSEALIACFTDGEKEGLKKYQIPLVPSKWNVKQIILDGLINKDI